MDIEFLGGAREIGRSAILISEGRSPSGNRTRSDDDNSLLLDFGMSTDNPPRLPLDCDPDAVVVSHGHLDHAGAVPALLSGDARPAVHWTGPTKELAMTLARDTLKLHGGSYRCPFTETELARLTQVSETYGYGETFEAAGYEVTFYNAGHIPGSAHIVVDEAGRGPASSRTQSGDDGETRLLYTGDFHTDSQRLVSKTTARPDADLVICESTYSDVEHEKRAAVEKRFVDSVKTTLWEGGTVIVPAFAIGRTQEMLLVCEAHDIPCYVDGMGKEVTEMLKRYPKFLRDPEAFRRAKSHARFVTGRDGQRKRITDQKAAIITTSGMLSGGPAMSYIPEIRGNPTNKITLTGYQVEGTPGRELLDTGSAEIAGKMMPVAAQVEQYDFSAHADRDGLFEFLSSYEDTPVLVNHGDRCAAFAAELRDKGYEAKGPELGETIAI